MNIWLFLLLAFIYTCRTTSNIFYNKYFVKEYLNLLITFTEVDKNCLGQVKNLLGVVVLNPAQDGSIFTKFDELWVYTMLMDNWYHKMGMIKAV